MKHLMRSLAATACGVTTSALVAFGNVAFARWSHVDLFTFSLWFIVPVGALVTGLLAATGFIWGALRFHARATRALLLQIVVVAGLTQVLIYWLGYTGVVLDDGRKLADLVTFPAYLDTVLTKSHLRLLRYSHEEEMGLFGYVTALIQFLGFLVGGYLVYGYLKAQPVCAPCDQYYRSLKHKLKRFATEAEARAYYEALAAAPMDGPQFADLICTEAMVQPPPEGAVEFNTALTVCRGCKTQLVTEWARMRKGQKWIFAKEWDRRLSVPAGMDLEPVFAAPGAAPAASRTLAADAPE